MQYISSDIKFNISHKALTVGVRNILLSLFKPALMPHYLCSIGNLCIRKERKEKKKERIKLHIEQC